MIRTASPCCQSAGAKNRPQTSPAAVSTSAGQRQPRLHRAPPAAGTGPGLANRCRCARRDAAGSDAVLASTAANIARRAGLKARCTLLADGMSRLDASATPRADTEPPMTLLAGENRARRLQLGPAGRQRRRALDRRAQPPGQAQPAGDAQRATARSSTTPTSARRSSASSRWCARPTRPHAPRAATGSASTCRRSADAAGHAARSRPTRSPIRLVARLSVGPVSPEHWKRHPRWRMKALAANHSAGCRSTRPDRRTREASPAAGSFIGLFAVRRGERVSSTSMPARISALARLAPTGSCRDAADRLRDPRRGVRIETAVRARPVPGDRLERFRPIEDGAVLCRRMPACSGASAGAPDVRQEHANDRCPSPLFPCCPRSPPRARQRRAVPAMVERAAPTRTASGREQAKRIAWMQRADQDQEQRLHRRRARSSWFEDGTLNASATCLDRHLADARRPGRDHLGGRRPRTVSKTITYRELHEQVCRLANALKSLGVKKGDRVTIYLPMVVEAAVAMLACARIGAIHAVVFGGFSPDSLANRIQDCDSDRADHRRRGPPRRPQGAR